MTIATTFSYTYDVTTPDGGDSPTEADDRMRETKAAVQERENVDHYWPKTGDEVSDADAGEHRKVTLRVGSAPTHAADKGIVYAKDVSAKAELFYIDEDGDEIQLTSGGKILSASLDMKDEDDMTSDSATHAATQQSIKKYVDDEIDALGQVLQVVNTQTGTMTTETNVAIPRDNTKPQNSEGNEFMTLAITPTSATSKLRIDVILHAATTTPNYGTLTMALFQDTTADALAVCAQHAGPVNVPQQVILTHYMTAGTTSATTFKIRAGWHTGTGTVTFNGISGGGLYNGMFVSSITITEYEG
jgi:hypothetical protein